MTERFGSVGDDGDERPGFMDLVKNPELRQECEEQFAQEDAEVERLVHERPEVLVRMLLDEERAHLAARAIRQVGPAVAPALIAALGDAAYRSDVPPADEEDDDDDEDDFAFLSLGEPIEAVLECLGDIGSPEAIPAIVALLDDANQEVRGSAALALGATGAEPAVEPLRSLLHGDDDDVRTYALMGASRALEEERATPGFRQQLFDVVLPLARGGIGVGVEADPCCGAATTLVALDRERAVAALSAPDQLAVDSPGLGEKLDALREAGVSLPAERLLPLIEALEPRIGEHADNHALGAGLRLLARCGREVAQPAIDRGLRSSEPMVRHSAAEALAELEGVSDPIAVAFDRLEAGAWEDLSQPLQNFLAVRIMIDEVYNGGFAQYFLNSSGNTWKDAVRGLEVIGATRDLQLVQRVVALFGAEGPNVDQNARSVRLAALVKQSEEVFDDYETALYGDPDEREVLLLKYVAQHAADFRAE